VRPHKALESEIVFHRTHNVAECSAPPLTDKEAVGNFAANPLQLVLLIFWKSPNNGAAMTVFTKLVAVVAIGALIALLPARFEAQPSVYLTGTTIYDPEQAWSGYIVFTLPNESGTILLDMNGNEVKRWEAINASPGPARMLPGGHVMGPQAMRAPYQESLALLQLDWEGNEVWRFDHLQEVLYKEEAEEAEEADPGEMVWGARQHHDWQRQGSPVGYYSPQAEPLTSSGKTLLLAHKTVTNPKVSDKTLGDDYVYEVSWDGEILWDWLASDHIDEFGLSEDMRNIIHRAERFNKDRGSYDWTHINSAAYVGPNKWYDEGDERFHPENIMLSIRWLNVLAIIDRSGAVVWRMGPDYRLSEAWSEIGQMIGHHHPHIIPKGLPGAGNLLVFDNGGTSGYGFANPAAPNGTRSIRRHYSRVLEIDPVTYEKVWEYQAGGNQAFRFFSHYISSAQRLPNGNTMITEGSDGRLFEVTSDGDIVWEYVSPFLGEDPPVNNGVYRAYRVPYDWVPQLNKPVETAVVPAAGTDFRVVPVKDED
jgi:hypothetical protein